MDYSRVVEVFLFCVHPLYLHATCIVHMKSRKHHHTNVCSLCINHCPESLSGGILSLSSFYSSPLSIFGSFLFPLLRYSFVFFACYCECRIRWGKEVIIWAKNLDVPPVTYCTAYNLIFSMYKVLEAFQTKCAGSCGRAGELTVRMRKSWEEGLGRGL